MRTLTHDEFSGRLDSLNGDRLDVFGPELGEFSDADRRADKLGDRETEIGMTTIGTKIEESVVLAIDIRANVGYVAPLKDVQKVGEIHPMGALAIADSVSAAQSLIGSLRVEARLYEARRGKDMSIQALSTLAGNFFRSGGFYIARPILDGVDEAGPHICSIDPAGSILEEEHTIAGSGSQCALGMLEQEFEDGLNIEGAKGVVTKAIRLTVGCDLTSDNGISIAVVTKDGVDTQRHQNFEGLE